CWHARGGIRPEGFKAYVYRTALNLASNRRRSKKLWRLVSFESLSEEPPSAHDVAPVVSRHVQQAVDALPDQLKRVLFLGELAGMSYREIAAVTGVEEGTVGSRRNRALALLRKRLDPSEGVPDANEA